MDVTVFGDELLKAYRGDLGISATKTDVTVTKDGVSYQAGRTLPIGTYTIVATPQGSATLTSLEVNGESFVSGDTIDVIFGTNINITAVSEGGEPQPVTDLSNTKWTYVVRNDLDITPISPALVGTYKTRIHYLDKDGYSATHDFMSDGVRVIFQAGASYIFQFGTSKDYTYLRFNIDGTCSYDRNQIYSIPLGNTVTIEFGEISSAEQNEYVLNFFNTYFTQVVE